MKRVSGVHVLVLIFVLVFVSVAAFVYYQRSVHLPVSYAQASNNVSARERNTLQDATALSPEFFGCDKTTMIPHCRMVALYGTPDSKVLGALGHQSLGEGITRVKQMAADHQIYSKEPVIPAFEIITTVASATPTANGDYSNELSTSSIEPWVRAAEKAGVYVILDLQSGRSDFLRQAKLYESLLKYPNVGLALDPEWRLAPDKRPVGHIGSVDAVEVNTVSTWLADLVERERLPQKLLLMHQFKTSMITNRDKLDTSRTELAYVIHMDGHGNQQVKRDTWRTLMQKSPANLYFGWKNFYKRDTPMLTPAQTMQVAPAPWYVSYQ